MVQPANAPRPPPLHANAEHLLRAKAAHPSIEARCGKPRCGLFQCSQLKGHGSVTARMTPRGATLAPPRCNLPALPASQQACSGAAAGFAAARQCGRNAHRAERSTSNTRQNQARPPRTTIREKPPQTSPHSQNGPPSAWPMTATSEGMVPPPVTATSVKR